MRVPKSFDQITVEQYQELLPIYLKDKEGIDTWVNIIAILTNSQVDDIEALPLLKLKKIIKSLGWLVNFNPKRIKKKYLFINGKLHRATLTASDFNTAQYVEIKNFLGQGNAVNQMHKILASIYVPLTWKGFIPDGKGHAKRAEAFKKKMVGDVYPTVFFYSKAYKSLIKNTLASGINQAEKHLKEAEELLTSIMKESSESIWVGTV